MLVLSRRIGEKVCIDGEITLTVLAIHGNRIRLGITAPEHCHVRRAEIPPDRTISESADLPEFSLIVDCAPSSAHV